jgi:spectinomycin phosphotransferase
VGVRVLDELMAQLRSRYGIAVSHLIPSDDGADPAARSFRAVGEENWGEENWFVKTRPGSAPEVGAEVCAGLAGLQLPEILSPVRNREGKLATAFPGGTFVVWPFRAGRNGFEARQPPSVLETLGRVLRAVHDAPIPPGLRTALPVESLDDHWRRGARRAVGQLLPQQQARIERLAADADRLVGRIDSDPSRWVLCHADLHAGNVLVEPDGGLVIIDWDTATLAPRERDLMFPGAAVAGAWATDEHVTAFLRGYQSGRAYYPVDEVAVAYFRCNRICEDIVVSCREIGDPASSRRHVALRQLTAQFEPGDVVDVAEQTLRRLSLSA